MKKQLLFLLRTLALTMLLFMAAKVAFMLALSGPGRPASLKAVGSVLAHGLSLDLSTSLYILAVPFLVCLASVWVRVPGWVLRAWFALVAAALALAFVADTSLYAFWGFKLDAQCLEYLRQPEGITQSVSVGYLLLRALLVVVLALLFWWLYGRMGEGSRVTGEGKSRFTHTLAYVLLMPLMVIGIRGGVSESTTNIGQVYFSQNQFLNHAAVNPVFSFLYSLSHQTGDLSAYHFFSSDDECRQLTQGVYTTESLLTDTLLTTPRPRTVVVVLAESAGEQFAACMPRLQQLKELGVNFSQCYANSWRTDRGTVCALSGYPSFPTLSVMKMPQKSRSLPSLARTLQGQGYRTHYLYGGDINFTNMRSYLIATGWEQLTSKDDYPRQQQRTAEWGVCDDITCQTLLAMIEAHHREGPQAPPLLVGYSTLSSHEPWDVPREWAERQGGDAVAGAFAYADDCLGRLVDALRQSPAWNNLLLVITADHGINHGDIDQSRPLQKNHIPMLWLGGAVREPRTVGVLCNQTDLAATLLGQMGLPHHDFTFSRDVLSATYTHPAAVHNYNNAQWIIDSTGHALYDFTARRTLVDESTAADSLLQLSKAMLQLTTQDLEKR